MTTAIDIITRALNGTGSLEAGEVADYDTAATGLSILNDMLDSWSIDRLYVFQMFLESFALTSGVETYLIGSGATFNTTRPTIITKAFLRVSQNDYPFEIIDDSGYANITTKSTSTGYPEYLNYNPTMPSGTIKLWPVPQADQTLFIESPKQLTQFASLTDNIVLAPGYAEAIKYSLMRRLAAEGLGKVNADQLAIIDESVARLKIRNSKNSVLYTNLAFPRTGNIFNGDM